MSLARVKRRSGQEGAPPPAEEGDPDSDHVSVAKINRHGRKGTSRWYKSEHARRNGGAKDLATGTFLPWFHGLISRKQAEELLQPMEPGAFLVRVSESRFAYVLSIRSMDRVFHFMIEQNQKGEYGLSAWAKSEEERFIRDPICQDLQGIVQAYTLEAVNPEVPKLSTPCCHDEQSAQKISEELLDGDYTLADNLPDQTYDMGNADGATVNFAEAIYDLGNSAQ